MPKLAVGDCPTWIQAVTTTLALIAAGYAAWQTHRTIKLELERDRDRRMDDERREAQRVSMWLEPVTELKLGTNLLCHVYLINGNQSPMHNATLSISGKTPGPGGIAIQRNTRLSLFTLPPDGRHEVLAGSRVVDSFVRDEMNLTNNQYIADALNRLDVELIFNDSTGRRWGRSQHGRLRSLDGDHQLPAADESFRWFGYTEDEIQEMGAPD
jgi:hypothetical protein